jgi:four helix bundle protein
MAENLVLKRKSYDYSLKTIRFLNTLNISPSTKILRDQAIRSVTSISANIVEAKYASSDKDFLNFRRYSLKSANETLYWLKLIKDLKIYKDVKEVDFLINEGKEVVNIIYSIVLKLKEKSKTKKK